MPAAPRPLLAVLACAAASATASAQLVQVGSTLVQSTNTSRLTFIAGPEASFNASALTLTADASYVPDPNLRNARGFFTQAFAFFQVDGDFPVEIRPRLDAGFKVVNAGGNPTDADRSTDAYGYVALLHVGDPNAADTTVRPSGTLLEQLETERARVSGNGFAVSDEEVLGTPYVLVPGVLYAAQLDARISTRAQDIRSDVAEAVIFEGGGESAFPGLRLDLNARVVPEPATAAALLTLGGATLLRRRRRRVG